MNKSELAQRVARRSGMSENLANQVVSTTFEAIEKALTRGERVSLVGFGAFEIVQRAARVGRNPRTGESINIPEYKIPRFRPGKVLRTTII
ncbi:MAG: HU family DNA-binding protein [Magnetococcales bacterium]|nr:HU family DNA-binding protein [Magnetococcales bacterium]